METRINDATNIQTRENIEMLVFPHWRGLKAMRTPRLLDYIEILKYFILNKYKIKCKTYIQHFRNVSFAIMEIDENSKVPLERLSLVYFSTCYFAMRLF